MSNELRGVAYFFCAHNDSESHTLSQTLCSLAAHLIRYIPQPEAGPAMRLFEDCDDGTLAPKVNQIQDLLINMINGMEAAFICIDAIDECKESLKTELLKFIFVIIGQCDNARIILSSRSGDSEISESLACCPSITITPHAIAMDIEVYIQSRIDQGPKRLKMARSEYMVNRLEMGAEGMYGSDIPGMHSSSHRRLQVSLGFLPDGPACSSENDFEYPCCP